MSADEYRRVMLELLLTGSATIPRADVPADCVTVPCPSFGARLPRRSLLDGVAPPLRGLTR